jgi:hypothetical protein
MPVFVRSKRNDKRTEGDQKSGEPEKMYLHRTSRLLIPATVAFARVRIEPMRMVVVMRARRIFPLSFVTLLLVGRIVLKNNGARSVSPQCAECRCWYRFVQLFGTGSYN